MTKFNIDMEALTLLFQTGLERNFSIMDICDAIKLAKQLFWKNVDTSSLTSIYETFVCALFDQYDLEHTIGTFYNLEVRAICYTIKSILNQYENNQELLHESQWDLFDQLQEDLAILYGSINPYETLDLINQAKMLLAKTAEPCIILNTTSNDIDRCNNNTLAHTLLSK